MFKELYQYLKEYWCIAEFSRWLFLLNFLTALIYKALAVVRPFVAALIIQALTEKNAEMAYHYVLVFFLVYLGYRLAKYLDKRAYSWNVSYSYLKMQDKIFKKLVNVDSNFTREVKKGEFMNTVNADLVSIGEMGDDLSEMLATTIQVIAVIVIVGVYNWIFAILVMISLAIYVFFRNQADRKMNFYWYKTRREEDNYSSFIGQVATGLNEVKTFNLLPKLIKKLNRIQSRYDKYYKKQREQITIRDNDVNFSYYAFQVLLYIILVMMFAAGQMELSILILIVSYHTTVINYASDLLNATNKIRLSNASVKRIDHILNYQAKDEFNFGRTSIENLEGEIEFKNISLKIGRKSILSNVSFKVEPHEVVAITGFPGAGKTMLFNLLLRLKQPTRGEILLDDININDFTKEIYTSSVAVANQAPFIFNTSIRNNLNFVNTDIKAQIKACKTVGIHDFIESLPQGYNTVLRENAVNVSGGQKQMIAIARTILTDAEILLLDDVTNALDAKMLAKIPKLIEKLRKNHTVMIISKNPEILALADRVIVLDKGKIEAVGTPKNIFDKSKTYRALQFISPDKEGSDA